jgi:hypothetical protein
LVTESLDNNILVHELQLGEQLNESVHGERRADFSLLLAMLTDDVRSHSQFSLPQTEQPSKIVNDDSLRVLFKLPAKAPLALDEKNDLRAFNQAALVEDNKLAELHLNDVLSPKPLAFRDDKHHIEQTVLTNTSLHCQKKYQQVQTKEQHIARRDFNAVAWLTSVQQTIVKAPLLDAIA